MLRLTAAIVLTAVVGLNPTTGPLTGGGAGDAAVVYRETLPGVAWVVTAKPCAGHIRACEGTAWVADAKNRLLVTNHHVTAGAKAIRVYFPAANDRGSVSTSRDWYESNGPGVAGRVVAADEQLDPVEFGNYVRKTQDSLRVLAEETGGIAVVNQNDFTKALKRIDAETSDYYVLGYYSSNPDPLKRTRKVEVKVTRPNLNVISRTSYTLRQPPAAPSQKQ